MNLILAAVALILLAAGIFRLMMPRPLPVEDTSEDEMIEPKPMHHGSKRELVKDYVRRYPDEYSRDLADRIRFETGITVLAAHVSMVRMQMK